LREDRLQISWPLPSQQGRARGSSLQHRKKQLHIDFGGARGTVRPVRVFLLLIAACASGKPETLEAKAPAEDPRALRAVASFSSIADRGDRSRALFLEASRVFLHPRCANCHPSGDTPAPGTQEELGRIVQAWVETGAECPPEGAK